MADKKDKEVVKPVELPPRIHISEFLSTHTDLGVLQKAGFKATVKKEWMRLSEWQEQFSIYSDKNRKRGGK
jgi:hypothetical protein